MMSCPKNRPWKWISNSGFTLMEILMTIFIFSIISGACYMSMTSGMRSWRVNNAKMELSQELRKSRDWMTEDLRQSGTSAAVMNVPADDNWYTSVTFRKATGVSGSSIVWSTGTFQYVLGGTGNTTLQRISDAGTQVIAQNIVSFSVRRQASVPAIIEIKMEGQANTMGGGVLRAPTFFKVRLRNG